MNTEQASRRESNEVAFDNITRAITDNASNALFLTDDAGKCTFLNPAAEAMFGYPLAELQDKPLHDYIHYLHPDGSAFPMRDCPIGKSVFSLQALKSHEDRFIRKDGSFVCVKCFAKSMTTNGRLTGILLEVQDITEEKKAAMAIRESEERYRALATRLEQIVMERTSELQRSNSDLLQFAHVASHDLKEPVRKVLYFSSRLQSLAAERLTEEEKTCLAKVSAAGDRLKTMMDGILSFSSANGNEQAIGPVDLNQVLQEVVEDLELLIDAGKATVTWTNLPVIQGAHVLLYQLFYNLVNNALKFSREDTAAVVTISGTVREKEVEVTVDDNGIGFREAYAEKIFEPFVRLNSKDQFDGTGLGLNLCKKVVGRHNGTIEAASLPGGGARFLITLPLRQEGSRI